MRSAVSARPHAPRTARAGKNSGALTAGIFPTPDRGEGGGRSSPSGRVHLRSPAMQPRENPRFLLGTADGEELEAQLARPPGGAAPRAGMVLCHPHPQFGGTMRSLVTSALFSALPTRGVTCLRFNYRGVEGSTGSYGGGAAERLDAEAAVAHLAADLPAGAPLVLTGWSFGADVALSVDDPRVAAWFAIALPLRFGGGAHPVASRDPRPKVLTMAGNDELVDTPSVAAAATAWSNTEVIVIPGASHFFVGRTDDVVDRAATLVDRLVGPAGARR